ncbi:MAG: curlin repeat-containing protein [Paludibacter sp.]
MKKSSIVIVIMCLFSSIHSFGQTNIQQIISPEFASIILEQNYISSITQLGNKNSAKLVQTIDGNLFSLPNTSSSYQQGNENLVDIFQKGSENVLFSFQLGYLISGILNEGTQNNTVLQNMLTFTTTANNFVGNGDNNTLISSQIGSSNKILTIQQGSNNFIDVEQVGRNQFFSSHQVGTNNRVENFKQTNIDGKGDYITQLGDNNTFNISETTGNLANNYIQQGSNLSVALNIDTPPALGGGITVSQTGHDMKVVIDQSFFSFPLK